MEKFWMLSRLCNAMCSVFAIRVMVLSVSINTDWNCSSITSRCASTNFEKPMSNIFKLSEDVAPSLRQVFEGRGWVEWDGSIHGENEWNMLWTTKRFFTVSSSFSLHPFQKMNHFRRTSQITKKDNLTRNIKRMRANFGKIYNFYPISYQFPLQYSEFVSKIQNEQNGSLRKRLSTSFDGKVGSTSITKMLREQQRRLLSGSGSRSTPRSTPKPTALRNKPKQTETIWIAKPSSGRRGENISLFTDVADLHYTQPMIIQKYISSPLLVGGYKFDLRIYVLITSFRPLTVHCYDSGLCRFSTQQYDLGDLDNVYSHLTNSSINKTSDTLHTDKLVIGAGCKWTTSKLFTYLQTQTDKEEDVGRRAWSQIHDIILLTLIPIIMDAEQCPNCFELFGFDILIDSKYNCWLLEVNGSPAIGVQTEVDKLVKLPMLNDLIDCVQDLHSKSVSIDVQNEEKGGDIPSDPSQSLDVFSSNVGGFQQIFPFNANTFESNKLLTDLSDSMISNAQKWKTIVVKEIKRRRCRKKKKSN